MRPIATTRFVLLTPWYGAMPNSRGTAASVLPAESSTAGGVGGAEYTAGRADTDFASRGGSSVSSIVAT